MTNVIRQLIVLKSVKDDKNFLSPNFDSLSLKIRFPCKSLKPGIL